jgi:hypothetical protein
MKANKTPRGIRNNNPLNLKRGIKWKGLDCIQDDPVFCQFCTASDGFRAAFICLRTYYNKHDCKTIRQIIQRWAPPTENSTEKYIDFVCAETGWGANQTLPPLSSSNRIWINIVLAMAKVECGKLPIEYTTYAKIGFYNVTK